MNTYLIFFWSKRQFLLVTLFVLVFSPMGQSQSSTYCLNHVPESGLPDSLLSEVPVSLTADTGYASYLWNTGATDAYLEANFSGLYSLTITSDSLCVGYDTIWVSILPVPEAGIDSIFCNADSFPVQPALEAGLNNQALLFTPQDSLLLSDANFPFGNSARSFELWVYAENQPNTQSLLQYGDVLNQAGFELQLLASDSLVLIANGEAYACPIAFPLQTWIHLALVVDATGKYSFFYDGEVQFTGQLAGTFNTSLTGAAMLGSSENGNHFNGMIDEFRVWNRELSGEEIRAWRFTHLASFFDTALVLYHSFNELANGSFYDVSGFPVLSLSAFSTTLVPFSTYYHAVRLNQFWLPANDTSWIQVPQTTQDSLIYTDGLQEASRIFQSTLAAPPALPAYLSACQTDSIVLFSTEQYDTYQWNNGSSTDTLIVFESGLYSLQAELGSCVFTDSVLVELLSVEVNPAFSSICAGEGISLSASSSNGLLYWSNDAVTDSISLHPDSSQYVWVMSQEGNLTCYDSAWITVHPLPVLSLPDSVSFCNETSAVISSGLSGDYTYQWNTGSQSSALSLSSGGWYFLTATNEFLCAAADSSFIEWVELQIDPLDTLLCEASYLTLSVNASHPFEWFNGSTAATQDLWVNASSTIWVQTVLGSFVCADSVSVSVSPPINSGLPDTIANCTGDSILLEANPIYVSYSWNNQETSSSIWVSESGEFMVNMVNQDGCSLSDTAVISIIAAQLTQSDDTICEGESVWLNANTTSFDVLWSNGSTEPVQFIYPTESVELYLTVSDAYASCYFSTQVEVIQIATGPISGELAPIASNVPYEYSVPYTEGSTYAWQVSGGLIDSVDQSQIWVVWNNPGSGYLQVVESNDACEGLPVSLEVSILNLESFLDLGGLVYPNPVKDQLWIDLPFNPDSKGVSLRVYTVDFRLVKQVSLFSKITSVDMSELNRGIYVLVLEDYPQSVLKVVKL